MFGSLTEQLTAQFYLWEQRGRAWQVWENPVELEPPYEPFSLFYSPPQAVADDGRKTTFFGSLADKFKAQLLGGQPAAEASSASLLTSAESVPAPFQCDLPLIEIGIRLPPDTKISYDYAEQLLLTLSTCGWPVSYEVIGSSDAITVQLACREPDAAQIRAQLQALFPEATLTEGMNLSQRLSNRAKDFVIADFGLGQEFMRPLREFNALDPDPLTGVFGALENLGPDEAGGIQVLFQITRHPWAESILQSVMTVDGEPFFDDAPEMVPLAREKVQRPLYAVVLRVFGQSTTHTRAWEIVKSIAGGLTVFSQPESNELIPLTDEQYDQAAHVEDVLLRQSHRTGMLLNSDELVGFVHLPSASVKSRKLLRSEARKTKAAPHLVTGFQYVLGENIHDGKRTSVGLSPDLRLRHIHVVGSTGVGKSTLLLNLIAHDMKLGNGLAVFDPHGDLIDRVMELVPENRLNDVVLFDPVDAEFPIVFNVLEARSEIEKTVLSSDLVALFRRFSTSWGDQMTTVLGNAVSAFVESDEGGTLLDLRRFLIEEGFRKSRLESVRDPQIVYFWEKEFQLLRGTALSSILTRLDIFLRPKVIRNIVGQQKGIDCAEIMDGKKIFLVKLAQGLVGEENAFLLGSLLVSKLHQTALGRQAKAVSERQLFVLYIDEFQHFLTPSMTSVLEGARKFGLGIVASHQTLRQLWQEDSQLANSLIANPVTRICFRLGDFDAEKLAGGFSHFDAADLENLGVGEAIVRVERRDYDFNLKTAPSPVVDPALAEKTRQTIIALSREKYGRAPFVEEPPKPKREELVVLPSPPLEIKQITNREKPDIVKEKPKREIPKVEPFPVEQEAIRQHRYLQTLIKQMAEQRGYRATIEEPTPDGNGRVDVGLERNGKKLACEISVTTSDAHELQNIKKCLTAGYETVLVCSPEKRNLQAIKGLVQKELEAVDQAKILFFEPDELILYLDQQAAKELVREERVKGYRVKVHYQAVSETERIRKREAIAHVIVQSIRKMKRNT